MAGTYNILREYTSADTSDDVSSSPHWVMAVVRLGKPLSYSRKNKKSVTLDVSEGAKVRGKTLVITSDCLSLQVQGQKEDHLKQMSATLIESRTNYLVEILPGDWVLSWIVHSLEQQRDLVERIKNGKACNDFGDGFKFLGRVESVRKILNRDPGSGAKTSRYSINAYGFRELDSQVFYDHFLGEYSIEAQNLGTWLAKVGLDIRKIFKTSADEQKDNAHVLVSVFLELLLGTGVAKLDTGVPGARQVTGGGATEGADGKVQEAPFAYLVPKEVGDLLGKTSSDTSKAGGILAYADIMELVFGVQKYENTSPNDVGVFTPTINEDDPLTRGNHRFTGNPMLGSFLPLMPNFDNRPLWNVLQQYLNPVVNEMYTCLRVNERGSVVPTTVLRQIPFTTDVLAKKFESGGLDAGTAGPKDAPMTVTPYLTLPQWVVPGVLVQSANIGRSDASRCNFVHVYAQDANLAKNVPITTQIVLNPPIRDDLDIQRSGLHTFMATVAARISDQVGNVPGRWMELIADHMIGAQWTLNGSLTCKGIQAPICEGDNLLFDGVVYHIEGVSHNASIDTGSGVRSWTTTLTLSNGMRNREQDTDSDVDEDFPIYPGFDLDDNTDFDPGRSVDDDGDENDDPGRVPQSPFDPDAGDDD